MRSPWIVVVLSAVAAGSIMVAAWTLGTRFQQTNDKRGQQAAFNTYSRYNWHKVICFIQNSEIKGKTAREQARIALFWAKALGQIGAAPCELPPTK